MIGAPTLAEPYDFSVSGEWEPGEESWHTIDTPDGEIEFAIEGSRRPEVTILGDCTERDLWTVVEYCRVYGVPGVWKERLKSSLGNWRLGGLYLLNDFDLTDRETDYAEYGENPYVDT